MNVIYVMLCCPKLYLDSFCFEISISTSVSLNASEKTGKIEKIRERGEHNARVQSIVNRPPESKQDNEVL